MKFLLYAVKYTYFEIFSKVLIKSYIDTYSYSIKYKANIDGRIIYDRGKQNEEYYIVFEIFENGSMAIPPNSFTIFNWFLSYKKTVRWQMINPSLPNIGFIFH